MGIAMLLGVLVVALSWICIRMIVTEEKWLTGRKQVIDAYVNEFFYEIRIEYRDFLQLEPSPKSYGKRELRYNITEMGLYEPDKRDVIANLHFKLDDTPVESISYFFFSPQRSQRFSIFQLSQVFDLLKRDLAVHMKEYREEDFRRRKLLNFR
jgi:hypothetical protein